jgi:hypothetical protein
VFVRVCEWPAAFFVTNHKQPLDKTAVFWYVALCSLVEGYQPF